MAELDTTTDPLPARFARVVKDARERSGLSQAALAEQIGASLDHISKVERGKYAPSLVMAARLIRALKLDANALIEAQPTDRSASRRRLDAEAALMRLAEGLDDRTLDTAIALVRVLAGHTPSQRS